MGRDLIGVTLGKYHCVEFIGHGGMAEVYRAVDIELDRVVALKVLHPFLGSEEGFMERFRREARTLASLQHPNIVQIYDSGLQDFNSFVVMEYVPGPTLKDRLRELNARGEQMPIPEVRRIFDALFAALRYAHRAGIVHRDLKPNNVILANDGRVVLTDFGLAKIIGSAIHTASMAMIGTPAYMAPEQAQAGAVDLRSDLYSLGVILFELLTGRLPFEAETPFAMITKHTQESLPRVSKLRRDLPRSLDRVLLTATAKDPAERFQIVDRFAEALNAAFEGRRIPFSAIRPRLSRATRVWIALAGAFIVFLGVGSARGWFNGASPVPTPTTTPNPTPTATPRILRARIIGTVDLFERPDPTSPVIGRLEDGTEVAVLDRSGLWWLVRALNDGREGWVMVDSLDFIPTPTPTPTLTNTPPPGASLTPTPSRTPRPTPTPSPTASATPDEGSPADTPAPPGTLPSTATKTRTPVPSSTAKPTQTPNPTHTSPPSSTSTPPPNSTPTPTPTPSATPWRQLTGTPPPPPPKPSSGSG
ncbi:MAG: protein kinase domain-containing protein [Anaerolineae bacterium]